MFFLCSAVCGHYCFAKAFHMQTFIHDFGKQESFVWSAWLTQNPGAQEEAAARPPAEATASSTIFAPGLVRIPAVWDNYCR